jgi:hypothetical protein
MKNLALALMFAFVMLCSVGCSRGVPPIILNGGVGASVSAGGSVGVLPPGSTGAISPYGGSFYSGTAADPRTAYAVAAYDQARLAARASVPPLSVPPVIVGGTCVGTSCPLPAETGTADSDLVRGILDQTIANTDAIEELREHLDD